MEEKYTSIPTSRFEELIKKESRYDAIRDTYVCFGGISNESLEILTNLGDGNED